MGVRGDGNGIPGDKSGYGDRGDSIFKKPVGDDKRNWEVGEGKGGGPFGCWEGIFGIGGLAAFMGGIGPFNRGEGSIGMEGLGSKADGGGRG